MLIMSNSTLLINDSDLSSLTYRRIIFNQRLNLEIWKERRQTDTEISTTFNVQHILESYLESHKPEFKQKEINEPFLKSSKQK